MTLMSESFLTTWDWTPGMQRKTISGAVPQKLVWTCRLCVAGESICVASTLCHPQSFHHTQNKSGTWCQGGTWGVWDENINMWCNPLPSPEIPCQVILFLESLITMDTGEGSMKGSCLVCCHMRSEFARHLEKDHTLFGGGCQEHNKYQQVYLGPRKIKTTSTWKVLSQCGQAILPSCLALWLLLCCCSWYWETHIFPHLEHSFLT